VQFNAGISGNQIWFQRVVNDLQLTLFETGDKILVKDWYAGADYHIDTFNLSNNQRLLESNVQNLVSAMAGFAPPVAGSTSLPANYQVVLNPIIAANWK
jgi:hypothetical protein